MIAFDLSGAYSRIRVTGASRLDFLHRMSTGDIARLAPGQVGTTVFTTPIGRMVDYAWVLAREDDVIVIGAGANRSRLTAWLRKYVFFNDDVSLSDASESLGVYCVIGQRAPGGWGASFDLPAAFGAGSLIVAAEAPPLPAWQPADAFEAYRVAAGFPAHPNEINEEHNPLEAGLWRAVSFTKGCYIGQEIIARMESRGRLAKRLMRLRRVPGARAKPGDDVRADGIVCGRVTSAVERAIGDAAADMLAYVATGVARSGSVVEIGTGGAGNRAHIIGEGGDGASLV